MKYIRQSLLDFNFLIESRVRHERTYTIGLAHTHGHQERRAWNQHAVTVLGELDSRAKTLADEMVLARYSGQGAIGGSFSEYYTHPDVAAAIWKKLQSLSVGGTALEPACGTGVLMQHAPANVKFTAVEYDQISSQIARHLFPEVQVHNTTFEHWSRSHLKETFDLVVGNPPFGPRMVSGLFDKPHLKEASRYFAITALDHLKADGLGVLLLPHGILRGKTSRDVRKMILARAEVLAVHALPSSAFSHAGAEFASVDIWFLRGRQRSARIALETAGELGFQLFGTHDAFLDGTYHEVHPEWMHAVETTRIGVAGRELYYREGELTPLVLQRLEQDPTDSSGSITCLEVLELLGKQGEKGMVARIQLALERADLPEDGEVRFDGDQPQIFYGRWIKTTREDIPLAWDGVRINDLLKVHAWAMAEKQHELADGLRCMLANTLQEFVNLHGTPHKNPTLERISRHSTRLNHLLAAVDAFGEVHDLYRHSYQVPIVDHDATNFASIIRHLHSEGRPATAQNILQATFLYASEEQVKEALFEKGYALSRNGEWQTSGQYYDGSGPAKEITLKALLHDTPEGSFEHRVFSQQLQEVLRRTQRKTLEDLEIYPTNPKVPLDILEPYLYTLEFKGAKGGDMLDVYRDQHGMLQADVNTRASKLQQRTANALKRFLTNKGRRLDEQEYYNEWNENFKSYLIEAGHRELIEDLFNDTAAFMVPEWSREPLHTAIPGWSAHVQPHWWQHEAVNRTLDQGNACIAMDVGLGKTYTGVLLVSKAKQDGVSRKPVIVVPKSVMGNWRKEFLRARPNAKLLLVGAEAVRDEQGRIRLDEDGQEIWREITSSLELDRQLTMMKMYLWDAVIMTIDTFTRIPMPDDRLLELIEDEFSTQHHTSFKRPQAMDQGHYGLYQKHKVQSLLSHGEISMADLQKAAERVKVLDQELQALNAKDTLDLHEKMQVENKKTERTRAAFFARGFNMLSTQHSPLETPFTELGVDMLVVDEAHRFSNVWTFEKGRTTIKYLGAANTAAQRALDLYYKSRHMFSVTGGKGLVLLTATPLRNSPVELYNIVSLVAPHLWQAVGILNVNDFVGRFCEIEERSYYDVEREQEVTDTVLVGLKNLHELRMLTRQIINRRTAEEVGLRLPRKDADFKMINPTPEQAALLARVLEDPAWALSKFMRTYVTADTVDDYRLALLHLLKRIELDLEMLDHEQYPMYVSPKVEHLLQDLVVDIQAGEKVVVFCDSKDMPCTAKADRVNIMGYSFHEKLRRLFADRTGLDADQIAIVNATTAPSSEDRLKISNQFNNGRLRIVIGNRETMSEGMNLQGGVARIYCLDVPINPMRLQQQDGRVVRQGNTVDAVLVRYYLGTRGLDKDILDILWGKTGWYEAFWNGQADTIESASQAIIPNREKLAALRIEDEEERQMALEAINASEREKEMLHRRKQAFKTFHKLQLACRSLERLENLVKGGLKGHFAASEQRQIKHLREKVAQYQDRLRTDEAFIHHVGLLDQPLKGIIHQRSGLLLAPDQYVFFRNSAEDGDLALFHVKKLEVMLDRVELRSTRSNNTRTVTVNARSSYHFEAATPERLLEWITEKGQQVPSYNTLCAYRVPEAAFVQHLISRFQEGLQPLLVVRGGLRVLAVGETLQPGDQVITPYQFQVEDLQELFNDVNFKKHWVGKLGLPSEVVADLSANEQNSKLIHAFGTPYSVSCLQGFQLHSQGSQGVVVKVS